jgi:hypothetical protein
MKLTEIIMNESQQMKRQARHVTNGEKGHGSGKASAAMTPSVNDDAALGTRESMDRDVVHLRRRWTAAERSRQMNERVPLEEWKHFLPLHHLLRCIKRRILFPFDPRSD